MIIDQAHNLDVLIKIGRESPHLEVKNVEDDISGSKVIARVRKNNNKKLIFHFKTR